MYIYIERERERGLYMCVCVCVGVWRKILNRNKLLRNHRSVGPHAATRISLQKGVFGYKLEVAENDVKRGPIIVLHRAVDQPCTP